MPMMLKRLRGAMPYIVTAALFTLGAFALYRLLSHVSMAEVGHLIRATPASHILLALLCTVGGYAALAGYDWSALRFIGRKLPLPIVLAGSFLGYSIGNTVGAGPVTGGAVRYRIYSAMGLSAFDIAGISLFCSLSFGIGATLLGLGALAWHPHALGAVIAVPAHWIRWGAIAFVLFSLVILTIMAWRRSGVNLRGISLQMPGPALSLGQFFFTAAETILSAATLYILLPADQIGFATFLAVFSAAVMAGVLSHVPGGVGVFETVIVAALPHAIPPQEIAAGLLLYRFIYYILPFTLALAMLALGELRFVRHKITGPLVPLFQVGRALTPLAISAMTFVIGGVLMILPLLPPAAPMVDDLANMLPRIFLEGGVLISSAIGACLVVLAHGLLRRLSGAWWMTQAALLVALLASLPHRGHYGPSLVLVAACAILLATRREFHRRTRLTQDILGPRWCILMFCLALTLVMTLFLAHESGAAGGDRWWDWATVPEAARALRAAFISFLVMALLVVGYALRPGRLQHGLPGRSELARAAEIVDGQADPKANIALSNDKYFMFSDSFNSFLMYRIQRGSWVALHEPVGSEDEISGLLWAFQDAAHAAGAQPLFYGVRENSAPRWPDMGLAMHRLGEEAVLPLSRFDLEAERYHGLREAYHRACASELSFEIVSPPHSPERLARLREISDAWGACRVSLGKRFSVGYFSSDYLNRMPLALVSSGGRIVGFAVFWTTSARSRASVDLIRYLPECDGDFTTFLLTGLCLHCKAEGYQSVLLGTVALSGLETPRGVRLSNRLGAFIARHGVSFEEMARLRQRLEQFSPDWEPLFLALPPRANAKTTATDLLALINGPHPE
ncbi:bifunctional lysylphosphatidylglycerol flippase/synthetase MprF [Thioclava sp. GXIMD2076]|uniref:bifunctional lysylphosphatidylglycerol flippase/synthetase MprF n=1 Tax=Thioclava sp. GXIMD2076 TaxID=3131931 RepID=UPI0030D5D9AA